MTQGNEPRRPSSDLGVLRRQLTRELERLAEGRAGDEPALYRAYLGYAQTLAWQGVAKGHLEAPERILDLLLSVEPFIDEHLPRIESPAAMAALELRQTIQALGVASRALVSARLELRLKEERSDTEREVLRVLFENPGVYLGRQEVRALIRPELQRTPARIGQILVALHDEGLLIRAQRAIQGSANASFYALSPRGREMCQLLFRLPKVVEDAVRELANAPEKSHKALLSVGLLLSSVASKAGLELAESKIKEGLKRTRKTRKTLERVSKSNRMLREAKVLAPGSYHLGPKKRAVAGG